MPSAITQTHLPVYTLEQTTRSGDTGFEITQHGGLTQQQKDLFFVPHRKDFYLLAFMRNGNARHWVDMVTYTAKPNTFYFSTPQQVFLKEEGTFEATSIAFTQEFLDMEDVAFIDDLCAKLLSEYRHTQGWRNSMLLAYLRVLLIYLSRLYTEQFTKPDSPTDRDLLDRFKALVSDHYTECHDVATYAGMLSLSPGHLGELIKKQSGKTPMEHIHDRLLMEAKRLLFHTEASAKEIAFRLGFEEASYFNRFFKRLTSATPLGYRGTIREMYH